MRPDAGREDEVRSEWAVPASVRISAEVDLTRLDPAAHDTRPGRQCIAVKKAGGRCTAPARKDGLLCTAHAGHLDSTAGGHARAAKIREQKGEAEERMVASRLGARAVIRQSILDRHDDLRATIDNLLDDAKGGDRRAQQILLGYLTQGFGSPTVPDGAETPPDGGLDVTQLSTEELRDLANGRASDRSV